MRALVVYESMFGNTEALARSVAEGIEASMSTEVAEVGAVPDAVPADVALLVVGGPTHALSMSWPSTRRDAAGRAPAVISHGRGIREWLGSLPGSTRAVDAATFDTRTTSYITGSAARAAGRRLDRLGYRIMVAPASFRVTDATGPLAGGELDRAREWGRALGARAEGRRIAPSAS